MEGCCFGLNCSRPLWVRPTKNVVNHARRHTIKLNPEKNRLSKGKKKANLKKETLTSQSEEVQLPGLLCKSPLF